MSERLLSGIFTKEQSFSGADNSKNTRSSIAFEIWWNFFYDLFSIKNVADVNSIDSFISKWNMEEFSVVKRSHGHKRIQHPNVKKSSKPRTLQDTFNDLLSNIQKPLGIHHIRTILFSLPVNYLKVLRD
jgi:N-glycosylase/DNA lyase